MDHIKELYRKAFSKYGDSSEAVLWPKGRQDVRFNALTKHISGVKHFSLLDFGCGLAHLRPFLAQHYRDFSYTGVDIVHEFVEANTLKYPSDSFLKIQNVNEIKKQYDYIVASGTFNISFCESQQEHKELMFEILKTLFKQTNRYLSLNFMTDVVDYKQEGAYHQNVKEIYDFFFGNLSKRIVIDQSYMPYEYTVTVWKDQSIIKPDNMYGSY